jgi:hypothetical protein
MTKVSEISCEFHELWHPQWSYRRPHWGMTTMTKHCAFDMNHHEKKHHDMFLNMSWNRPFLFVMFHHEYIINRHQISSGTSWISTPQVLKGILSFIAYLAKLPTWTLGNYNRIRWVFSTNYNRRLDRTLRRRCKPKLVQFGLIAVMLCRLSGVVGSRTRGFVNSR